MSNVLATIVGVLWFIGIGSVCSQTPNYYYTQTNFGTNANYDVTLGNPHRGLASAPYLKNADKSGVKHSLESDYVRFESILVGYNQTNFTKFDALLNEVMTVRNSHFIPRLYIHYPGQPLALPQYLLSGPKQVELMYYTDLGTGLTPNYGNKYLLEAIEHVIRAFGKKYDGDYRIHAIQIGLLGRWGEWHNGFEPSHQIPESTKNLVLKWFYESFKITPIQARYPTFDIYHNYKFGFHDDSFTWYTLDGSYDGGSDERFYFYRVMQSQNILDFWKYAPMGGEVRPENSANIFDPSFPAGTKNKQDFYFCSQMTHSTYNKIGTVFADEQMSQGEIDKANWNNARMGYAYQINSVGIFRSTSTASTSTTIRGTGKVYVDMDVVLENIGIAPIYFPTSLVVTCPDIVTAPHKVPGVDKLINQYSKQTFRFLGIPATTTCLNGLSIKFDSKHIFSTQTIKFAQGDTGYITVKAPLPPTGPVAPVAPTPASGAAPGSAPVPLAMNLVLYNTATNSIVPDKPIVKSATDRSGTIPTIGLSSIGSQLSILVTIVNTAALATVEFVWKNSDGTISSYTAAKDVTDATKFYMGGKSTNATAPINAVPYLSTPGTKEIFINVKDSEGLIVSSQTIVFVISDYLPFALVSTRTDGTKLNKVLMKLKTGDVIDLATIAKSNEGSIDMAIRYEL